MARAMRQLTLAVLPVLAILLGQRHVHAQENAQTRIPNSLVECYMNPDMYERDYRLPATINILIDLVRKIEDATQGTQDIRQVAVSVLHRFRQDGIEKAPGIYHGSVLPFSPSGYQFSKHRLLLSRLIPGSARYFPNNTLSSAERCALHFILSSSIDGQVRGDEGSRCNQLQQYSAASSSNPFDYSRKKRYAPRTNYLCDIEMMKDITDLRRCQRRKYAEHPRARTTPPPQDDDFDGVDEDTGGDSYPFEDEDEGGDNDFGLSEHDGLVDVASNAISQCPVENGVIRTNWGSLSAGPLLAGIAAGLVQQNVPTRDLLMLSKSPRHPSLVRQQMSIDNRFAATLAGNLAEVALLQGPIKRQDIRVGSVGGWNSTTVPHWYLLARREHNEMTDAQIRGGIDGLIIAKHIVEWRQQASDLRLSQVLDMYYSPVGVFNQEMRSCNRRELFNKHIPAAELQTQAHAFSTVLDQEMQLKVTLSNKAIKDFADASTDKLVAYVGSNLQNENCDAPSPLQSSPEVKTAASDLHIFIDTTWPFVEIESPLAMLLDNIDVSRFGSRITVYNAFDTNVIVNTTSSLSEFYTAWSRKSYEQHASGLNLPAVLKKLREMGTNMLAEPASTGKSFVSLVMPQMANVNEADNNFAIQEVFILRETQPDLTLLFWAGGSLSRFQQYVANERKDLFSLVSSQSSDWQQTQTHVSPVVQRIRSLPRKIVNPRCNTEWKTNSWGVDTKDQYVESAGVAYYRFHPNYFFQSEGRIQVQGAQQSNQIVVCTSRHTENPRLQPNSTQPTEETDCRQLVSESYDIDLRGACDGYYLIKDCPPIYISVSAAQQSASRSFLCTDAECRFADNIKFRITTENVGCYSSAQAIFSHLATLIACISFTLFVSSVK